MKLYRFFDSPTEDGMQVICKTYPVIRKTECGYWFFDQWTGKHRFVLKDSRKRFCHARKKDALESYKARKTRQIKILKARLELAKMALESAKSGELIPHDTITLT